MTIKKFRVKNYKSIIDSGDCYLEDTLTILAGKNESGKTSLLEALHDFNFNLIISETVIPKSNDLLIPEISITFTLSVNDLIKYSEELGIEFKEEKEITIIKYYPNQYNVDQKTCELLKLENLFYSNNEEQLINKLQNDYAKAQNVNNKFFKPHGWGFFLLDLNNVSSTKLNLKTYNQNFLNSYINQIPDITIRSNHSKILSELEKTLTEYESELNNENENWNFLLKIIPNFILFKSFENNIPSSVAFDELQTNEFIQDIELISDFDNTVIMGEDITKKSKHKDKININFNKEYAQYWTQDQTMLRFEWDSNTLYIFVVEEGEFFEPSQRSKGKQWHISFYTRVSARAKEDNTNILLIDEPGLFLHASAQKDIYQRLLSNSESTQIIFTTHSPYLINSKELQRIRLVFKHGKKRGTEVVNKIHAKADKETLTPILTAIGLELNEGITNFMLQNNLVVEGPSDVFYLNAILKYLGIENINVVFGGGAGNMGNIGTILQGWGCKVIYIYDNDQGKKDGQKKLIKTWLVKKDIITSVSELAGSIEDLFTKDDFKEFVLNNNSLNYIESNSEYLKLNKIDKIIASKNFLNKIEVEETNLNKTTIDNFKNLGNNLVSLFDNYNEF